MPKPELPLFGSEFDLLLRKGRRRSLADSPLLDALLPILEYTPAQLKASPFFDNWLTAAVKAESAVNRAAATLEPLGITRTDLLQLLRERMQEQHAAQKRKRTKGE